MKTATRSLAGAVALTASALFTQAGAAEFRTLESPAAPSNIYVFGLSPNGNYAVLDGDPEAWRWDLGQADPLTLPMLPSEYPDAIPWAVTDTGVAVGMSFYNGEPNAVRWHEDGSVEQLPTPFARSEALDISATGDVIVGDASDDYGTQAARWMNGVFETLPLGAIESMANAVSADGQVVVGEASFSSTGPRSAFRWSEADGVQVLLPTQSSAQDVSDDGSVVVGAEDRSYVYEAFRWTAASGAQMLGDLPGGAFQSLARAVSGDGSTVVGSGGTDDGLHAFIWTEALGMRDLNEWLPLEYGLDLQGWTLVEATDISADGSILVGIGRDAAGMQGSWLVRLSDAAPPEPDSDGDGISDDWEVQYGLDPYFPGDAEMDFDGDGLTNLQEFETGNDPHNLDTDGDGIPDGDDVPPDPNADSDADGMPDNWEMSYGLDPYFPGDAEMDFDGDGLTNLQEFETGNNPHTLDTDGDGIPDGDDAPLDPNADSDGDGMPDNWEMQYGLDPYFPGDAEMDFDNDMLTNLREFETGNDPHNWDTNGNGIPDGDDAPPDPNADSDGDGMPDNWEMSYGLDPYFPDDALWDMDSDMLTNLREFETGNDPHNWDTNGNGIPDGDEAPPDPNADSDGDTMTDAWETGHGLDPWDPQDAEHDNDVDWLRNAEEFAAGTDPHVADTDADGLPDGEEAWMNLDPARSDTDGDTMPDGWEVQHELDGTDPADASADPDWDYLGNADEYLHGTDPNHPDTDEDMFGDHDEVEAGTDPLNPDTDGDGMPDGWEAWQAFDPLNAADAGMDADYDGLANGDEYAAGSDPRSFDTDGDGIGDGDESAQGTSPVRADTDQDGLSDNDELALALDPVRFDTDMDGIMDGLEHGSIARVSVVANSREAWNGASGHISISANGRFVVFQSESDDLVPGDTNGVRDVFVRDVHAGTVERISVGTGGAQANGMSWIAKHNVVSADGRYVVFRSSATNLVAGYSRQIYLHDRATGETTVLAPETGSGSNSNPVISADGRYVAFESNVPALTGRTDGTLKYDVIWLDRQTGETRLVTETIDGASPDGYSDYVSISGDGRTVAYSSDATNLVPGDANGYTDAFVRDIDAGVTTRINAAADGTEGNKSASYGASLTADGSQAVFESYASNLVPGDTSNTGDVFLYDLTSNTIQRVASGVNPSVSADGRYVAFAGGANCHDMQILVHDRVTSATTLASSPNGGGCADDSSGRQGITLAADGSHVAFVSQARNLVPGDANYVEDAFIRKLLP